jgi:hypothetical protein
VCPSGLQQDLYDEALGLYRKLAKNRPQVYTPKLKSVLENMIIFYTQDLPNPEKARLLQAELDRLDGAK